MIRNKNLRKIILAIQKEAPQTPGVYLFYDAYGKIIYIGKSVNLRQRMLSYFCQDLSGVENRIKQMIFNIRDFVFHKTETDLLALLLEDKLIKQNLPYFNIRQQEFFQYQYLLLTDDVYPTLKMVDHSVQFENMKVFGPFKDQYFVDDILKLIRQFLHLRSCTEPEPVRKSLNFEMGFCKSPCRQKILPEEYSQIVGQVIEFLNGNEKVIINKLTMAMENSATALEFEKALELKNKIEFCKNFCVRQRFIHRFKTQNLILYENDPNNLTYVFTKGQLATWKKRIAKAKINEINMSYQKDSMFDEDNRFLLDRANIVYNWIKNKKNKCEYYFA